MLEDDPSCSLSVFSSLDELSSRELVEASAGVSLSAEEVFAEMSDSSLEPPELVLSEELSSEVLRPLSFEAVSEVLSPEFAEELVLGRSGIETVEELLFTTTGGRTAPISVKCPLLTMGWVRM